MVGPGGRRASPGVRRPTYRSAGRGVGSTVDRVWQTVRPFCTTLRYVGHRCDDAAPPPRRESACRSLPTPAVRTQRCAAPSVFGSRFSPTRAFGLVTVRTTAAAAPTPVVVSPKLPRSRPSRVCFACFFFRTTTAGYTAPPRDVETRAVLRYLRRPFVTSRH